MAKTLSPRERDEILISLQRWAEETDRNIRMLFLQLVHIESFLTEEDEVEISKKWIDLRTDLQRHDLLHLVGSDEED